MDVFHDLARRIEYAPGVERTSMDYRRDTGEPILSVLVEARICCGCGAWLSLGAANDEPVEVQVEIRAAELAGNPTLLSETIEFSFTEHMGWFDQELAGTRVRGVTINMVAVGGWHAGYLAHAIATHEEGK